MLFFHVDEDFLLHFPAHGFGRCLSGLHMSADANNLSCAEAGLLPAQEHLLAGVAIAEQEAQGDVGCSH